MPVIRADPWEPGYGVGFEAILPEDPGDTHPFVEREDWSSPIVPPLPARAPLSFVDGVMRVELRLVAQDGPKRVPGLFGSWAAGCVRCDGKAAFGGDRVGRSLILGGAMGTDGASLRIGGHALDFVPVADPGTDPAAVLLRLQQVMRAAEAAMAAELAGNGGGLVLADGPLTYVDPAGAPVVGVVKRFVKHYLDAELEALVPRLGPGERTPLFGIGAGAEIKRYSWYVRLLPVREPWHAYAGVVRCEVGAGVGLASAVSIADRVTAILPRFGGRPADPRAPQNLMPVGALETRLHHRMGDRRLIRRALNAWLIRGGA